MAEVKSTTVKEYPEEAKLKLETLVKAPETKEAMKILDSLDNLIATTPTPTIDKVKEWARQAIGYGNYLRKKHAKLEAAAKNEKTARFMELKLECAEKGITFYAATVQPEVDGYIAPLRMIRDIIGSYVVSADSLISVCRMHIDKDKKEQTTLD